MSIKENKLKTVGRKWEKRTVNDCSACGGNHRNLVFFKLPAPVLLPGKGTFTDRAKCPNSNKFVYARATPERKTSVNINLIVIPLFATGEDIQAAFVLWGADARGNPQWNKAWMRDVKRMNPEGLAKRDTATFLGYLTKHLSTKK